MILRIPTSTDPTLSDYTQRVQLDGREFWMRFRFNERSGYWYLDLSDVDGVMLLAGRKLVRGAPLRGRAADPRLPPGILVLDGLDDPGLTDVTMLYIDAASAAALAAGATPAEAAVL